MQKDHLVGRDGGVPKACEHRFITSTVEKGWHCASRSCGVKLLSLSLPIPMPLIESAIMEITKAQGGTA